MKGVIASCLGELIVNKFGKEKWEDCLEMAGLPRHTKFLVTQDIQDKDVMNVVQSACKVLNLTLKQAADAFGDYWVNEYAPKLYKFHFGKVTTAKDFLLNMDNVHKMVTKNIPNAHPPRFAYNWENDTTLVMNYQSNRGLIEFLVGLIKGVGVYFKEDLKVLKLGEDKVKVIFAS